MTATLAHDLAHTVGLPGPLGQLGSPERRALLANGQPFNRTMRRHIIRDLEPTILLTQRVAVLQAAGHRRADIARITGATPTELKDALARVKRIAPLMELPNPQEP